jgi:hypothetical protein
VNNKLLAAIIRIAVYFDDQVTGLSDRPDHMEPDTLLNTELAGKKIWLVKVIILHCLLSTIAFYERYSLSTI